MFFIKNAYLSGTINQLVLILKYMGIFPILLHTDLLAWLLFIVVSAVTLVNKQQGYFDRRRLCCLESYPLQVRHKQDWGRGFMLLLPQAAVLPA